MAWICVCVCVKDWVCMLKTQLTEQETEVHCVLTARVGHESSTELAFHLTPAIRLNQTSDGRDRHSFIKKVLTLCLLLLASSKEAGGVSFHSRFRSVAKRMLVCTIRKWLAWEFSCIYNKYYSICMGALTHNDKCFQHLPRAFTWKIFHFCFPCQSF